MQTKNSPTSSVPQIPLHVLQELTEEISIPVSDCFISLGLPNEFFKPEFCSPTAGIAGLEAAKDSLFVQLTQLSRGRVGVVNSQNINQLIAICGYEPTSQLILTMCAQVRQMEAAQVALKSIRPQLFLVETYRFTTFQTASGKGANPLHTETFGPGEERTLYIVTTSSTTTDQSKTSTVMETNDKAVVEAFNAHVANASSTAESKDKSDYQMNANFHGDATVGFGEGEANATVNVVGGSNGVRRDFSNAVANSLDNQIQQTSALRNQKVSAVKENSSTAYTRTESAESRQKNPNLTRAATFAWFPIMAQFHSFLSLVDVQLAFRNTDPKKDRQVPLHEADSILGDVLDPSKVSVVRDAIKSALQSFRDFDEQVRNIVEEVPAGPNKSMLRLAKNLQTTYALQNAHGEPVRNIPIRGVLINAIPKVIQTGNLTMDISVSEFGL